MRLQQRTNDRLIISVVCLVTGALLVVTGAASFIAAARHYSGVSRFLLGYTLLWSGLTAWMQHLHAKSLGTMMKEIGGGPRQAATDKDMKGDPGPKDADRQY